MLEKQILIKDFYRHISKKAVQIALLRYYNQFPGLESQGLGASFLSSLCNKSLCSVPVSAALAAVPLGCQPLALTDSEWSLGVHHVPRKAGGAAPEELCTPGEGGGGGLGQDSGSGH